jgi:hypothetical protein
MNGGTLNDLQALLGHSSPFMTQRYAHMAPGYLESKAQIVSIGISGKRLYINNGGSQDFCYT